MVAGCSEERPEGIRASFTKQCIFHYGGLLSYVCRWHDQWPVSNYPSTLADLDLPYLPFRCRRPTYVIVCRWLRVGRCSIQTI